MRGSKKVRSSLTEERKQGCPGILILTHGFLGQALIDAAMLHDGETQSVVALPLRADEDLELYADRSVSAFLSMPKGSVVLFDQFGGTPFNQFLIHYRKPFPALCGVNLPMLLNAIILRETLEGFALISALKKAAEESIVDVSAYRNRIENEIRGV